MIVFGFKANNLQNTNVWSKGGVATKRFLLWACVLQNVKSYRFFGGPFLGKFGVMFKKHYKNTR